SARSMVSMSTVKDAALIALRVRSAGRRPNSNRNQSMQAHRSTGEGVVHHCNEAGAAEGLFDPFDIELRPRTISTRTLPIRQSPCHYDDGNGWSDSLESSDRRQDVFLVAKDEFELSVEEL